MSPSAADAALGLIEGNPIYQAIMERRASALEDIKAALARNLAAALGDHPVHGPLRANFFSAHRPGCEVSKASQRATRRWAQ